jgi:transposase
MKNGIFYFEPFEGPVNKERFILYLKNLFLKLSNENLSNAIIILDNVAFHRCREVDDLVYNNQHALHFLPPYSPFFNPIENLFSQWKGMVKQANPNSEENLECLIRTMSNLISVENIQSYFRKLSTRALQCLTGDANYKN